MSALTLLYILLPFLYLFLISTSERERYGIVVFKLRGGLLILLFYMITLIFVDSNDKPLYLESYLDADNYYREYNRELLWGKIQLFLSSVLMKNETLYWLFYTFFYCISYYVVSKKYFPNEYAGYFVLCVVGCLGFVSYGSNTIRAGFGIALLLLAYCTDNKILKICLSVIAIGCQMSMLLPVVGYFFSVYVIKKYRWCECIWLMSLVITSMTSVVSDVMTLFSGLDARIEEMSNFDGTSDVYNVGFRYDFLIYSLIPILIAKYNIWNFIKESPTYYIVYKTYLLVHAVWQLLIRIPYTDRVAYLSWFLIPFLLLYPVLNGNLKTNHSQRYILQSIGLFVVINTILALR